MPVYICGGVILVKSAQKQDELEKMRRDAMREEQQTRTGAPPTLPP